jgi:hypothetical protein
MTTDYRLSEEVKSVEPVDDRLENFGVRAPCAKETTRKGRWMTHDNNSFWIDGAGMAKSSAMFALFNVPEKMFASMAENFDTDMFSGLYSQVWGYKTEEEWESAWQKIHGECQSEFYIEMMNNIRGEPHRIKPGTNGMAKSDIAKSLVALNSILASPDYEDVLMEKMNKIYHENYTEKFNLTEQDIATLMMMGPDGKE